MGVRLVTALFSLHRPNTLICETGPQMHTLQYINIQTVGYVLAGVHTSVLYSATFPTAILRVDWFRLTLCITKHGSTWYIDSIFSFIFPFSSSHYRYACLPEVWLNLHK